MSTLSPQLILDPNKTIAYSYELLLQLGLEQGFGYDSADHVQIQFPDGDRGAFVAIGFSGIARGYQFLYRIKDDQVDLVELVSGEKDWGIRSLQDFEQVDIETLELFSGADGRLKQVLKVTGAGHAGTGLWEEGYFQLINITDDDISVIFNGAEVEINANPQGWHHQYRYQYGDLDDDGNQEIIKTGQECHYQASAEGLEKTDCQDVQQVYEFSGVEYVERQTMSLSAGSSGTFTPEPAQVDLAHREPRTFETATAGAVTRTPTPSPPFRLEAVETACDGFVIEAIWISNEAFAYACHISDEQPLQWVAYDTIRHSRENVSAPLNYDHSIWNQLGVLPPPYAEVSGHVSPSGRYVIYAIRSGEIFSGTIETWIADTVEESHVMLFETDWPALSVTDVSWFDDENKALLHLGYEGSGEFHVVDVRSGRVVSLEEVSEHDGIAEEGIEWAVSPVMNMLAINTGEQLLLVSLKAGTLKVVERFDRSPPGGRSPSWSSDGKLLYYWGDQSGNTRPIRVYDPLTGDIDTLIELVFPIPVFAARSFSVSPQGDKIVFWDLQHDELYLIVLNE